MKKFVATIGLISLCVPVLAEESFLAKLAPSSLLLDIDVHDNNLVVVGERGHILHSQDALQWTQESVPTLSTLTAVDSIGEQSWVVGHDSVILHQQEKGAPWTVQMFKPENQRPFLDVLFFDAQHGIAVGAYGTFYRTRDGGKNWQKEAHPELLHPDDQLYLDEIRLEDEAFYQQELASIMPHINRVSLSRGKVYLAGEAGLLAMSEDLGQSWQRMEVDYAGSFFDVTAMDSGKVVAVGLRGNMFILDPNSSQWQSIDSQITNSLNSVVEIGSDRFVALGNSGTLICYDNGTVSNAHLSDGKALVAAQRFNQSLVAVTAEGIKSFDLAAGESPCQEAGSHL